MDERLFFLIYAPHAPAALTAIMVALSVIGRGWFALAILPLLAVPRARRLAAFLGAVLLGVLALLLALKSLVHRVRPWQALGLHPVIAAPTDFSFPSGHASGSFAVVIFLVTVMRARRFRHRAFVAPSLLALAASISLSRVFLGMHYPSDIAAGALLGGFAGWLGARLYLRKRDASAVPIENLARAAPRQ